MPVNCFDDDLSADTPPPLFCSHGASTRRDRARSVQKVVVILVTVILTAVFGPDGRAGFAGFAGLFAQSLTPAAQRDLNDDEARRAIGLIYDGRTDEAIKFLDSLSAQCGGEPFYLFIKSRVYRELLTIDDENKDQVEADARPILEDLDEVIETCGRRMEAGDSNPDLRLYRGLAWMSKSHVRSFARQFWRAGRDAKKGKKELEAYLAEFPENALARGTLGAFYYFADTIPGLFKFLSRLVLMPTGDREKGLDYIRAAAAAEGVFKTDFQILLYTVYFMFEGRFEDGVSGIRQLSDQYPQYARLAVPSYLMRPLIPALAADNDARSGALIDAARSRPPGSAARQAANLLHFVRAYSYRFYGQPSAAAKDLRSFTVKNPAHPDWAGYYAKLELGRLMASQGRTGEARQMFETVAARATHGYLRDTARDMLEDIDKTGTPSPVFTEEWITRIYQSTKAERRETITYLENIERPSLHDVFYLGDALLLEGDLDRAQNAFDVVLSSGAPKWDQEYQMLAACRLAEIQGARGDYARAARTLSRSLDYYHKEYLLDWIIESRQRYYERLADGREKVTPTLFCSTPR